jgi:hypothetical protein
MDRLSRAQILDAFEALARELPTRAEPIELVLVGEPRSSSYTVLVTRRRISTRSYSMQEMRRWFSLPSEPLRIVSLCPTIG